MSGVKRRSKYRKHVQDAALQHSFELSPGDQVVRVVGMSGGNLFDVEDTSRERSIALLPTKFKNLIWVRRGQFVVVSAAEADYQNAGGSRGRVRFIISHVLSTEQVKLLKKEGTWPKEFAEESAGPRDAAPGAAAEPESSGAAAASGGSKPAAAAAGRGEDGDSDSDEDDLFVNRNRALPSSDSEDD